MGEFESKVEQFKQTIQEPGFTTPENVQEIDENTTNDTSDNLDVSNSDAAPVSDSPPKTRKRHTNTFKKRIDQLTYENRIKEAQTQELLAKVQRQEQLLAEKQNQLEQNEYHKNAYYENNLQNREAAILNELKVAKEEGDVDKEISLSKALAQVTAEQSTYNLYKAQIKPKENSFAPEEFFEPRPNVYQQNVSEDIDYGESGNEEYESWLEKNPWADPESPNFSPRLRNEINDLATELDETLRYNGYADMIGTSEYFNSLDNLMADRYRVSAKDSAKPSNQSTVAPVSRRGSSMADQYVAKNPNSTRGSMSLTEDEYKIARNLQIKLPNGRYATGDEAVKRYAEAKRYASPDGSNKLVIE